MIVIVIVIVPELVVVVVPVLVIVTVIVTVTVFSPSFDSRLWTSCTASIGGRSPLAAD